MHRGARMRFAVPEVPKYEHRLAKDVDWAMSEGHRFFQGTSEAHKTLRSVCTRLNDLGIPYAVAGGMALFLQGFLRFTDDVDILVDRQGLKRIHEELSGRGYLPPFEKSKNLRDTQNGVRIEFIITNDYPGDGKPKPVAFPEPSSVSEVIDGIRCLNTAAIVELKLASGISSEGRLKDLGDVQELIRLLNLPKEFAEKLNPYVQSKYIELWSAVNRTRTRYVSTWRNKFLTLEAKSIDEMADILANAAEELRAMKADGVMLDPSGGTSDDYALLFTYDANVAEKYGFMDESEYWEDDNPPDDESEHK